MSRARSLFLFNYDWDRIGYGRWSAEFPADNAGFDLFSFPSNVQLARFDLQRFVDRLACRASVAGWTAVASNHEQFGVLAAAMLAERMGWPGTPVVAILACQHKLHARRILQAVAPEVNISFEPLDARYGDPIPRGLRYPLFAKPVKAAFSVLARRIGSHDEFTNMTRFSHWERWIIRRLVEPFERVARLRLPDAGTAHRLLIEEPAEGNQYNLDGYVYGGHVRAIGIVESVMYPGTQAFRYFGYPCDLPDAGRQRALDAARRFLDAVGFDHGLFNMEFLYDATRDRLSIIEFNPRMASQLSDLYLRVDGVDLHRVSIALARGEDPALIPRSTPVSGAAASFVYRWFGGPMPIPEQPGRARMLALKATFPDALLFGFPKNAAQIARDIKWLSSYRYGILHLGGRDWHDLRARCDEASQVLGWPSPARDAGINHASRYAA